MGGNFTLQYQLTPSVSVQAGYVTTLGRHLEVFPGSNRVSASFVPGPTLNKKNPTDPVCSSTVPQPCVASFAHGGLPFPDFSHVASYASPSPSSHYHVLQTNATKQLSGGSSFMA